MGASSASISRPWATRLRVATAPARAVSSSARVGGKVAPLTAARTRNSSALNAQLAPITVPTGAVTNGRPLSAGQQ